MKIHNINNLPIGKLERFCSQFNIALVCNDGKVGKAVKGGQQ